jgi:two-component system sporulation sensor kinase B
MTSLLLNLLFIILSIFIYQMFFVDGKLTLVQHMGSSRKTQLAIAILAITTAAMCMTFPFAVIPHFRVDLRYVPLILGTLYGGPVAGIVIGLFEILYRYLVFSSEHLIELGIQIVMIIVPLMYLRGFNQSHRTRKLVLAMGLTLIEALLVSVVTVTTLRNDAFIIRFLLEYGIINMIATSIAVYLIENMRETIAMRMEVHRSDKYHVLGELAASFAHEIRNPMTVAMGFLQLLRHSSNLNDKEQSFVNIVQSELERAELTIKDYLSFAKPQVTVKEVLDVGGLVNHVIEMMTPYATLHDVVIVSSCEYSPSIEGDSRKMVQTLVNIVKNGIEAMQDGGQIELLAYQQEGYAVIEVRDTGVGMTREELHRLGNPFYSTKSEGTGLGLMTAYSIVHAMHGTVVVDSEVGKGTVFRIQIPSASARPWYARGIKWRRVL